MRSKATLSMMEQMVMVLVFALAAALCVQVLVLADQTSRRSEARDRAVLAAQNAAEAMKAGHNAYFEDQHYGSNGNDGYIIAYDKTWQNVPVESEGAVYHLLTDVHSGNGYLWTGQVTVYTAEGEELVSIPVAGQKQGVDGHA